MGGLAAILRGWPARLVLGVTDFALALPRVVILLLLAALWQPSATLVVLTLGLTGWMPIARLTYGEALVQLKRPYTESARALGASRARVFARHVLPNAASLSWRPRRSASGTQSPSRPDSRSLGSAFSRRSVRGEP